ncbi:hypothetical protein L2703_13880 [Shewanella basaltis]|uniref:hypothetical protein n=1 Tax=Shewanella basaltis TaxID=472183 RepID=UPI00200E4A7B|nr:hypothetical protein [Shewanella basaltis]MCL1114677.1 hypothetical protein [Shewanella basaltis]
MTQLEQWLDSGLYVFVVLSEQGYQDSEPAKNAWPDAVQYGDYRMVNYHKANAERFVEYLTAQGYTIAFGISDTTPMLLTWDEAIEFAAQFATEPEDETTTP